MTPLTLISFIMVGSGAVLTYAGLRFVCVNTHPLTFVGIAVATIGVIIGNTAGATT